MLRGTLRWLNYHHLHYFWTVARRGSIAAASAELRLAPPTISGQIHRLEQVVGVKLFARRGRGLVLTEAGQTAFRYADQIFALGGGMLESLAAGGEPAPMRLVIGIDDALPRSMVYRILEPAIRGDRPVRIVCRDDRPAEGFLGELAIHAVDLVLADAPASTTTPLRAFSHLLGECGTSLCAAPSLARSLRRGGRYQLRGAPFLVPGARSSLRRGLDTWFDARDVRPRIVAELDDVALAEALGERGLGVFAVPSVIAAEVQRRYHVQVLARLPALRQRFYAISLERTIRHPAIAAICATARRDVFR